MKYYIFTPRLCHVSNSLSVKQETSKISLRLGFPHENEHFLAKKRDNAKSKTVKPAAARLHLFRKRLIFNTFSKTTFSYHRATGKKLRVTAKFCQKVRLLLQKARPVNSQS